MIVSTFSKSTAFSPIGRQSSRKVQVEQATLSLAILIFSKRCVGIVTVLSEPVLLI
jgi:hypothetical protein